MDGRLVRKYNLEETIRIMEEGQLPRKLSLLDEDMPLGLYKIRATVEVHKMEEEG